MGRTNGWKIGFADDLSGVWPLSEVVRSYLSGMKRDFGSMLWIGTFDWTKLPAISLCWLKRRMLWGRCD